ncbi:VWA domain-containing protein [bacterium]|jgi:Ca-activated chloride channel homolog|nr:VWA domain-containing protein [bacterium]
MGTTLHFAHIYIFLICLVLLFVGTVYRLYVKKEPTYMYPLGSVLKRSGAKGYSIGKPVLFTIRMICLFLLAMLAGKLQIADNTSKVYVEGRDIVLAIDVSGSMSLIDDEDDPQRRIDVAKKEALNFVKRRESDQIGLVIFGNVAVSRCPLTLDKNILSEIISEIELGVVPYEGTVVAIGMATAINRLKNSKAKSKVIILLTDGAPTENDINPDVPIKIAKDLGIKIYTIGVGDIRGGIAQDPFFGFRRVGGELNKPLLERIAKETGGKFFEAQNPHQMKMIYSTIDRLETSEYETVVFSRYQDYFEHILWLVLILILLETVARSFVWFRL